MDIANGEAGGASGVKIQVSWRPLTLNSKFPDYVAARIRRPPVGKGRIVPGSTPVISFGNALRAEVATLGWNPSRAEFLESDGRELAEDRRRLETLKSVYTVNLADAPHEVLEKVFEGCNQYFSRQPYSWFNKLQTVLNFVGASYHLGSACHLDLVQSATDPVWGKLDRQERVELLIADVPFLKMQLAQRNIRLLLLNGRGIVRACEIYLSIPMQKRTSIVVQKQSGASRCVNMYTGQSEDGLVVIGWNINLQSSFGVSNDEIKTIGNSVNKLWREMRPAPRALAAIETNFHAVIVERAGNLLKENALAMPLLTFPLMPNEDGERKAWFGIPGMYGGFAYWFTGEETDLKLVCESWCRVAEGSGQRHEITASGVALVAEGFV